MKYKLQSYLQNPRSKGCVSNGYSTDRQQITYMSDFLQQTRVSRHRAPATPSVKSAKRPPQLRGFPVCLSNNPVDARCVTNLSTFVQTKRLPLAAGRKTAPSAWRHPVCKGVGEGCLQAEKLEKREANGTGVAQRTVSARVPSRFRREGHFVGRSSAPIG